MSVLFPVEDGSIALYMHAATQEGRERGHIRHFAFNEDTTEHMRSPVIALKSLIADADASR